MRTSFDDFMSYLASPRRGCLTLRIQNLGGYSMISAPGSIEPKRADRIACEVAHGSPEGDAEVLHLCSKLGCVNPLHLMWTIPARALDKAVGEAVRPLNQGDERVISLENERLSRRPLSLEAGTNDAGVSEPMKAGRDASPLEAEYKEGSESC